MYACEARAEGGHVERERGTKPPSHEDGVWRAGLHADACGESQVRGVGDVWAPAENEAVHHLVRASEGKMTRKQKDCHGREVGAHQLSWNQRCPSPLVLATASIGDSKDGCWGASTPGQAKWC